MKALTVIPLKQGTAELSDVDDPPESDGPVMVETLGVGICGTDAEILSGSYGWAPPGRERLVLGHESLGRVLEAPAGAPVAAGDLVVGIVRRPDPVPCGNCAVGEWDFCRNGQYTERGIKEHDGYLSERYRITEDFVVKVDLLGLLGVLLEPTSVVAKAWEQVDRIGSRARWQPTTAVVTGAGPVGLLAALLGVQRGLQVHVIDQMESGKKPDLVRALGAQYHTGPIEVACPTPDIVIECTGVVVPGARRHGARRDRWGGVPHRGVVWGPDGGRGRGRPWNRSMALRNESVVGSVNANRRHYEAAAAALAKANRDWLEQVVSRRVPLASWQQALERQPDDVKVMVEVNPA